MADDSQKPDDMKDGLEKAVSRLLDGFNRPANADPAKKSAAQEELFRAVKSNRPEAVLKLIEAGADLNAYNSKGQTALHVAAVENAAAAARVLIDHGANPRLGKQDKPTHTPLEDAVTYNRAEMVELLARHGGYLPGEMVSGWTLLHRACEKGKAPIVEALLNAGANCNEMTENGSTPLLVAVKSGHADVVRVLLQFEDVLETMNDTHVKTDEKKSTAFQLAVGRGHEAIVAAMIEKGANVNGRDTEGRPLLFSAIEKGNLRIVRLLVEAGADLNKPPASSATPLVHACKTSAIDDKVRAQMIDLLIGLGADTEISSPVLAPGDRRMTPLHLALFWKRSEEVVASLLRYPVQKDAQDGRGTTPLMYAAENPAPAHTRLLLEAGADPNARNWLDARTPLIEAVRHNNKACLELLLASGADPALYDGHGKSALSYAREKKQNDMIGVLEKALERKTTKPPKPSASPRDWDL